MPALTRTNELIETLQSMKSSLRQEAKPGAWPTHETDKYTTPGKTSSNDAELGIRDLYDKDDKKKWQALKAVLTKKGFKTSKSEDVEALIYKGGGMAIVSIKNRSPEFRCDEAENWNDAVVKLVQDAAAEILGIDVATLPKVTKPQTRDEYKKDMADKEAARKAVLIAVTKKHAKALRDLAKEVIADLDGHSSLLRHELDSLLKAIDVMEREPR